MNHSIDCLLGTGSEAPGRCGRALILAQSTFVCPKCGGAHTSLESHTRTYSVNPSLP
jgi:predicted RNA-binding Zn-ribbon protein involved in translation (DUF1610 family)